MSMSLDVDFNEIPKCRTCMNAMSGKYYKLNDCLEDDSQRILDLLDEVVPQIHIRTESPLSHSICMLCVDKLLTCHKFQQLCIETDNELRRLMGLSPSKRSPETIWDPLMEEEQLEMKLEIEDECEINPDIKLILTAANYRENQEGKGTDNSDTDSSNEKLNVLKERKLRMSLKAKIPKNSEFSCTDCGQIFKRLSRLKAHSSSEHARKRKFSCNICSKNFAKETSYRMHMQRHKRKINLLQNSNNGKKEKEESNEVINSPPPQFPEEKTKFSSEIFVEPLEDLNGQDEWLDSEDESLDLKKENTKKKAGSKPEHGKNIDFVDTGIGEIEKPNSNNRRNGNFPCEVCGKIFDRPFRLKRHSSVHSLDKPFACEICKCRFSSASYLKTHKLLHKNKSNTELSSEANGFKCPDCPRRFEKQTSLSAHRQIHTRNAFTASYTCVVCERTFMSVKTLTEHVTTKHPEMEKHTCDQCDKSFVLHAHLVEHLNRHKGNKNLVCVICEKEFGFMSTLKEHMRTHSGESPYLCPQCGKTFRNGSNLRQHMERHSGLKKYQCPECPSRFNCRSDLKKHIDTHNSTKSHECDICGSKFTRSYSLQKHKRLHLGKRPFKCDQCNMTFSLLYHLRRHTRTHTGEKPYKCKYCERAYAESGDLNKHLRSHVGENTYMCIQCPKAFKYQLELRQHHSEHYKQGQESATNPNQLMDGSQTNTNFNI